MIIQVTVGCSHNMCTFCGTYKEQKFRLKDMATIKRDIDEASRYRFDRVFLADGDVLILPTETLLEIISYIKKRNPHVSRIGVYANTKSILRKTPEELRALHDAGIGIVYQGIESGNKEILRRIRKGAFPHRMKEAAAKVMEAGILLSQTVLLGIGGVELSAVHAEDTGRLLGEMSPDYASALTVMILKKFLCEKLFAKNQTSFSGFIAEMKHLMCFVMSSLRAISRYNPHEDIALDAVG